MTIRWNHIKFVVRIRIPKCSENTWPDHYCTEYHYNKDILFTKPEVFDRMLNWKSKKKKVNPWRTYSRVKITKNNKDNFHTKETIHRYTDVTTKRQKTILSFDSNVSTSTLQQNKRTGLSLSHTFISLEKYLTNQKFHKQEVSIPKGDIWYSTIWHNIWYFHTFYFDGTFNNICLSFSLATQKW